MKRTSSHWHIQGYPPLLEAAEISENVWPSMGEGTAHSIRVHSPQICAIWICHDLLLGAEGTYKALEYAAPVSL